MTFKDFLDLPYFKLIVIDNLIQFKKIRIYGKTVNERFIDKPEYLELDFSNKKILPILGFTTRYFELHGELFKFGKPAEGNLEWVFANTNTEFTEEKEEYTEAVAEEAVAEEYIKPNLHLNLINRAKKERARSLDLGNCGLNVIPEEVFELEWLEELILSNSWGAFDPERNEWIRIYSSNQGTKNRIGRLFA